MRKHVAFAVAFAFLASVAFYASGGLQAVYAAVAWQCTKCGLIIHHDPHEGGYDPACPNRGIHAWVKIDWNSTAADVSSRDKEGSSSGQYEHTYKCSKCGKEIHSDPHHGGYDPACPAGGIHAWVQVD